MRAAGSTLWANWNGRTPPDCRRCRAEVAWRRSIRPVKETLTKAALIILTAEQNDVPRKTVAGVFATLESVLLGSVHPRGVGEFTFPGPAKSDPAQGARPQGGNFGSQSHHCRNGEESRKAGDHSRKNSRLVEIEDRRFTLIGRHRRKEFGALLCPSALPERTTRQPSSAKTAAISG
jgi:hypothetical protein